MSKLKMRGRFSGAEVVWEDGKLICHETIKRNIEETAKGIEKNGCGVFIGEYYVGTKKLLDHAATAYALISNIEPVDILEGKKPTIPKSNERFDTEKKDSKKVAKTFDEILKFNPYHDSKGRFASANGYASFTYSPGKSKAHDLAIAREKERQAAAGGAGSPKTPPKKETRYSKEEQIEAVKGYTYGDYGYIRQLQCGDKSNMTEKMVEEFTKKGEALEQHISESPKYKGAIYRGINVDRNTQFKEGQTIDMRGTSSWSQDKWEAEDFAGLHVNTSWHNALHGNKTERAVVFEMKKAPKKCADVNDISSNYGELEVIVSKDTRFKITKVKDVGNATYVTVVEA